MANASRARDSDGGGRGAGACAWRAGGAASVSATARKSLESFMIETCVGRRACDVARLDTRSATTVERPGSGYERRGVAPRRFGKPIEQLLLAAHEAELLPRDPLL